MGKGIKYVVVVGVVAVVCFLSCSDKPEQVEAITDRTTTPSLRANEVTTVVSDSGITRYRVNTAEWLVYDKAEEPYWEFPKGIHLEKFDFNLDVDAEIQSNYAIYYEKKKLWDLRDSVRAINVDGEHFESDRLFWDENTERVYSDSKIKITQKEKVITGRGFESNQSLTKYVIRNPEGIFPISEED